MGLVVSVPVGESAPHPRLRSCRYSRFSTSSKEFIPADYNSNALIRRDPAASRVCSAPSAPESIGKQFAEYFLEIVHVRLENYGN